MITFTCFIYVLVRFCTSSFILLEKGCSNQVELSESLSPNKSIQKTCRILHHYGKRSQKLSTYMSIFACGCHIPCFVRILECWTMPFICGPCAWKAMWRNFINAHAPFVWFFPSVCQQTIATLVFMNLEILLFIPPFHTLDILHSVPC
jgi:hypothetical protein